jgi:hypothetical protein
MEIPAGESINAVKSSPAYAIKKKQASERISKLLACWEEGSEGYILTVTEIPSPQYLQNACLRPIPIHISLQSSEQDESCEVKK